MKKWNIVSNNKSILICAIVKADENNSCVRLFQNGSWIFQGSQWINEYAWWWYWCHKEGASLLICHRSRRIILLMNIIRINAPWIILTHALWHIPRVRFSLITLWFKILLIFKYSTLILINALVFYVSANSSIECKRKFYLECALEAIKKICISKTAASTTRNTWKPWNYSLIVKHTIAPSNQLIHWIGCIEAKQIERILTLG